MEEFYKDKINLVKKDPYRPQFHFIAPVNWMNDPNVISEI
jgi:sucrose-6-phosphate hydrolase SacC (GH32 family)